MPTITTKAKQNSLISHKWIAVINQFIVNGRNATKAYEMVYKDCETAPQAACRLFKNVKFVAVLDKRLAEISAKNDIEVGLLEEMYRDGYEVARLGKNGSGMAQNTTGIARLYGKDKDNNIGETVQIVINSPKQAKTVESEVIENE